MTSTFDTPKRHLGVIVVAVTPTLDKGFDDLGNILGENN